jgi:outer membrane immunogenic protein
MMKTIHAAIISGLMALAPGLALAQDAWRNSTVIIPERFTWSGVYAGVQGGLAEFNAHATLDGFDPVTSKPRGGFGGGHIGVNYQIDHLVFGLESDMEASSIRKKYDLGGGDELTVGSQWMGSARARFGMAYNRVLFYATAGLAISDARGRVDGPSLQGKLDKMLYGHTIGFGVEYAFSRNFSMRAEWRTTNFQPKTYSLVDPGDARLETDLQAIRIGASYRF